MLTCFVFTSTVFLAPRSNSKKEKINKHITHFIQKKKKSKKQNNCFIMYFVFRNLLKLTQLKRRPENRSNFCLP